MRKLLLATVAVAALLAVSVPGMATVVCDNQGNCSASSPPPPQPPVVVQPPVVQVPVPVPVPQPIVETWWIYNWVHCNNYGDCVITIDVDGLNVRDNNNNVQFAVPNGTPVHIVGRNGRWLNVTFSCQLVPTGLWSDTAGVPFMACR